MTAMSQRRDPRSLGKVEENEGRRARSFVCRDDLYEAFTRRANELECGVDWLVGEAMKRLLADAALKAAPRSLPPPMPLPSVPLPPPAPTSPVSRRAPLVPPPPPPRSRRATGSFVGEKTAVGGALALRLGEQRVVVEHDRFVHGVRVTRAPIRPGDVLDIGPFTIAVERA
jgi:hypothetical protein